MIPSSLYCGLGLKVCGGFLCAVVEMSIPHNLYSFVKLTPKTTSILANQEMLTSSHLQN